MCPATTDIINWYAGQTDEDAPGERVLFATSETGDEWTAPAPMFDRLTPTAPLGSPGVTIGNDAFALIGDRLYGVATARQWRKAPSEEILGCRMARRVSVNGKSVQLGPIVWLQSNRSLIPDVQAARSILMYTT